MLVTSNFSFSHNIFYPMADKLKQWSKIYFVVCKFFQFGHIQTFIVWYGVYKRHVIVKSQIYKIYYVSSLSNERVCNGECSLTQTKSKSSKTVLTNFSLHGLHRLTQVDALHKYMKPSFHRAWLICIRCFVEYKSRSDGINQHAI